MLSPNENAVTIVPSAAAHGSITACTCRSRTQPAWVCRLAQLDRSRALQAQTRTRCQVRAAVKLTLNLLLYII